MIKNPKLFISYAHENEEHKEWVLKLATDLRKSMGIDVMLDQWDLRIGQDLSLFMEQGLSKAEMVICVCSNGYVLKANLGESGSGYEKMILAKPLLKNTNVDYIIPIIRCNDNNELPIFLGTKLYIDFSDDDKYLNKLTELAERIYDKDKIKKPSLGESPFSKAVMNEVIIRTDIEKSNYHNPNMSGAVSFDFKNNSGQFTIGNGKYEFFTMWSECGNDSIYSYNDKVKVIGYLEGISEIPKEKEFSKFNFSSRTRELNVGEVIIWMNNYGNFAATLVTAIEVKSRGAKDNLLSFEYKIYN